MFRSQNRRQPLECGGLEIPLANPKMSDKLQFVEAFGSGRMAETSDKLKFVGAFGGGRMAETSDKLKFVEHFPRPFALLPNSPAVSS